jgi:hypothetical protein
MSDELSRIASGQKSPEEKEFMKLQDERQKQIAKEVKKGTEQQKKDVKDTTKTTPTEVQASKAPKENQQVVPETTDEMSAKHQQKQDIANQEDVGNFDIPDEVINSQNAGATGMDGMNVKVDANINIRMDTKMFRAEMATIVASAVSSSEVRTALVNAGFVNQNT